MIEHSYQLVVVGDHLGGLAAAALSAKRGRRVLLFENTEEPAEQRPLEYLNAICGGPDRETGLGSFFHDLGLSPFGPLGNDRIHFRPLLPPLQVILPGHRVNIYQDRVARYWEMEREFGDVENDLREVKNREEAFRERFARFRAHRPKRRGAVKRATSGMARFLRFRSLSQAAERDTFSDFLRATVPAPLGDALAGQACGVTRVLRPAIPWYVGMRSIQVLQGGLFQNAAGQSGILNGLREAFLRFGGESRPLVSLESVEMLRTDAMGLELSAAGSIHADEVIVDLPLEKGMALFNPEVARGLRRKGLDAVEGERAFALVSLKIRKGWKPECMGDYLVVDPALGEQEGRPTLLLAWQPGDSGDGEGSVGIEILGLFPTLGDPEGQKRVILDRLEALMPFLGKSIVGEPSFTSGRVPLYQAQGKSWRQLEEYYSTGRRQDSFRTRRLTFLRNEDYIGTGLAAGLMSGIRAVE